MAAATGLVVFWLTHLLYLLTVKVPAGPTHRDHEAGDFLAMLSNLYSLLFEGVAPAISYKLGLYCDPILYGGLSLFIAFIVSFFFPCRPSTPASASPSATAPASAAAAGRNETDS